MKIIFAAGGTGGHINPALAAAGEIKKRHPNSEILFIGTEGKMETKLVPSAGFQIKTIEINGFYRKPTIENLKKNIKNVVLLFKSSGQTKQIIKDFSPDVVVGFGGYVSGPVLRTAHKMGIKTAIHEQNAFPGVTNKALSKMVDRVMLTARDAEKYMKCKNKPAVTGLPVRGEILLSDREFSRASLKISADAMLILSMGGSLGAKTINENIVELVSKRCNDKKLFFIHATGQYGKWVPDKLKKNGVDFTNTKNVVVREYIDDMQVCLAAADLIIGRAGASSLSEIEAMGKASILIPSPNVSENHQYYNALALVKNNAAMMIEEKDLTEEKLISMVDDFNKNREKLKQIGDNAKKMAILNSKEKICDIIEELTN
ncbi:MAG: undecaprenyldiphospho-muramoylpentapeptide beta-N-acetylglucosaminyltransferase [Oscillospiraceae bacterium]